jgi:rhodanese-related sulfurtransferase
VNVELDDPFASYVGWVVPFAAPVALVLPEPADERAADAARALSRIGYERLPGYLEGGVRAWAESGRPTTAYGTGDVVDLCEALGSGAIGPERVLDVRQRSEWDAGHVDGSRHAFVGDLAGSRDLPDIANAGDPTWVICASGHRAAIAASLLDREGLPVRLVRRGGVARLLRTCPGLAPAAS